MTEGGEAWGVAKVVVTIVTSYRLVYMHYGIGQIIMNREEDLV